MIMKSFNSKFNDVTTILPGQLIDTSNLSPVLPEVSVPTPVSVPSKTEKNTSASAKF